MTIVVEKRLRGNPQPRLTVMGYTKNAGSPTQHEVRLQGETRFRRVYVWQFSNCGTTFVKVKGKSVIVHL